MKTRIPYHALLLLTLVLVCANGFVALYLLRTPADPAVTVSFFDVGQGDSILVEGPTGIEMLIDGGKDRSVVRELPKVMGPLDRSIDIVVATHPDADHIGGLPDVLSRYRVSTILTSGREADSSYVERFKEAEANEFGMNQVYARKGMRIHLGGGAYADVLHPEDTVAKLPNTNDASIVLRVVFGSTEFLLTGDAPTWVEDRLVGAYGDMLQSDVLKAGHHGSKTSTSPLFLATVQPDTVVISAGKNNTYGHPHRDVLENIQAAGALVLSTIDDGTITFVSDGSLVRRR